MENSVVTELKKIFTQTYDGTIKRDILPEEALSFEREFQAQYFSKMEVFMKSQNAYDVFRD